MPHLLCVGHCGSDATGHSNGCSVQVMVTSGTEEISNSHHEAVLSMCLDSYGLLLFPTDCLHSAPLQKIYNQLGDITTKYMKPLKVWRYLLPCKSAQTNANGISIIIKAHTLDVIPAILQATWHHCVAENDPEHLPDFPVPTPQELGLQATPSPQLQLCFLAL